jgi:hypothetical protein
MVDRASRMPAWAVPAAVFILSTLIFVAILEVLSALGARTFLIGVAHEAERALKALTPWEVPLKLFAQVQHWYMPGSWTSAVFILLCETILHSGTAFVVTLIQLAIGVFIAFAILDEWGYAKSWYTPPLRVALSLVTITVAAVPVFIIVYVVGESLGHIFPEASAAVYGGTLATGAITVTARTAEGGIHHAVHHTLERLFMRGPH